MEKMINKDFFIQLLNAWLHFTNSNFHIPTFIEETHDQPGNISNVTLSLLIRIIIASHPGILQTNLPKVETLMYFYNRVKSSKTFDEKLCFPTANHKIIYEHKTINNLKQNLLWIYYGRNSK